MTENYFSNNDSIKPIIYAKPERAHYCDIHKETFIFVHSLTKMREHKHCLKTLLRLISAMQKRKEFTKRDLLNDLKIGRNTLSKYMYFLKLIKIYRPHKRNVSEVHNKASKKYTFIAQPYIKEIVFFVRNKGICPILLMPKETLEDKLFNNVSKFVEKNAFIKDKKQWTL